MANIGLRAILTRVRPPGGRQARPPAPAWLIEAALGDSAPVHAYVEHCHLAGKRCRDATADRARRALYERVPACPHCRPDNALAARVTEGVVTLRVARTPSPLFAA
ncbi:DUF6233 domain-containing protein [Streptomyces sp. NBC_01304]|uniref:DUF6233 domain-containing protein n=1 Tax=Streptomyces sp. NBC_01304 TaxID=2903818 RepID=UPI003FA36BFA